MGLYHDDFILSRSLIEPVTTLYSITAWVALLSVCGVLLRWRGGRWLVFGIAIAPNQLIYFMLYLVNG